MFGIDLVTAGTLLTLAAAQPVNMCPLVKSAEINVSPTETEIRYDTSKTLQQIQSTEVDTIDPYGFQGVTMKQGYTETNIQMQPQVKLLSQYDPDTGAFCIAYDTITIKMNMSPVIVIAKEVYADPCMRDAIIEHEMKHVAVDRRLVNKYSKIMGQKVYAALEERGFRAEPTTKEYAQGMADRMQKVIFQVLEHEYKKLDLDRSEAQNAVDTVEEYTRVRNLCPAFNPINLQQERPRRPQP